MSPLMMVGWQAQSSLALHGVRKAVAALVLTLGATLVANWVLAPVAASEPLLPPDRRSLVQAPAPRASSLRLVREDSTSGLLYYLKARRSSDRNDLLAARVCLRRIWDNEGTLVDDVTRAWILTLLGQVNLDLADVEEAVQALEEAHSTDPGNPWATERLIWALQVEATRLTEGTVPWPEEDQRRLFEVLRRIRTLERELSMQLTLAALMALEPEGVEADPATRVAVGSSVDDAVSGTAAGACLQTLGAVHCGRSPLDHAAHDAWGVREWGLVHLAAHGLVVRGPMPDQADRMAGDIIEPTMTILTADNGPSIDGTTRPNLWHAVTYTAANGSVDDATGFVVYDPARNPLSLLPLRNASAAVAVANVTFRDDTSLGTGPLASWPRCGWHPGHDCARVATLALADWPVGTGTAWGRGALAWPPGDHTPAHERLSLVTAFLSAISRGEREWCAREPDCSITVTNNGAGDALLEAATCDIPGVGLAGCGVPPRTLAARPLHSELAGMGVLLRLAGGCEGPCSESRIFDDDTGEARFVADVARAVIAGAPGATFALTAPPLCKPIWSVEANVAGGPGGRHEAMHVTPHEIGQLLSLHPGPATILVEGCGVAGSVERGVAIAKVQR